MPIDSMAQPFTHYRNTVIPTYGDRVTALHGMTHSVIMIVIALLYSHLASAYTLMHISTVFVRIEARASISFQRLFTRPLFEPDFY